MSVSCTESYSKELRANSTKAEAFLWGLLRAKRFSGLKFRRQVQIGKFIVDFICHDKKLILECDGGQHAENRTYDQARDSWLNSEGYKVLRFWNNEVFENTEAVLEAILKATKQEICCDSLNCVSSPLRGDFGEIIK